MVLDLLIKTTTRLTSIFTLFNLCNSCSVGIGDLVSKNLHVNNGIPLGIELKPSIFISPLPYLGHGQVVVLKASPKGSFPRPICQALSRTYPSLLCPPLQLIPQ
jgi:hypothetical protein